MEPRAWHVHDENCSCLAELRSLLQIESSVAPPSRPIITRVIHSYPSITLSFLFLQSNCSRLTSDDYRPLEEDLYFFYIVFYKRYIAVVGNWRIDERQRLIGIGFHLGAVLTVTVGVGNLLIDLLSFNLSGKFSCFGWKAWESNGLLV